MSEFSRLVNISFEDATSYGSAVSGDRYLIPFWHFWGPVENLQPLNVNEFFDQYQESLPPAPSIFNLGRIKSAVPELLRGYADCKRAFSGGASAVLGSRILARGGSNYTISIFDARHYLMRNDNERLVWASALQGQEIAQYWVLRFKYFGIPTLSDLNLDSSRIWDLDIAWRFNTSPDDGESYVKIIAQTNDERPAQQVVVEEFSGTLYTPSTSDEYPSLLEEIKRSEFLELNPIIREIIDITDSEDEQHDADFEYSMLSLIYDGDEAPLHNGKYYDVSDDANSYTVSFINKVSDVQVSDFTAVKVGYENLTKFANLANDRKDCNICVGLGVDKDFTYNEILTHLSVYRSEINEPKLFGTFLAGREKYSICGIDIILDGVALWMGRMANVAATNHLNQLPSAQRYGMVNANLVESLTFDQVLSLHALGCNSLYQSVQGPCIFGIKTLHNIQSSYWAKLNISRVTANIIKSSVPIIMNVIHTEVVSDPIERSKCQTALQGILDDRIASKDIKEQSYVSLSDSLNTDKKTKGGEVLNAMFVVYFKKLAEKVNIKIVATDSSVDVIIS